MNGTPQLRSRFPATPPSSRRSPRDNASPASRLASQLPDLLSLKPAASQPNEPLIPFSTLDAPTQRLWVAASYVLLLTWRIYDFTQLQEDETESLWLFMKWVALDTVFFFGLPSLKIPWLEWTTLTMTMLFAAHATLDLLLMFRIPIPIWAGLAALARPFFDRELAVAEHMVKPASVLRHESLILGRQIIHILPEGSAVLNPGGEAFCIDAGRTQAMVPLQINQTNPISIDLLRLDLDVDFNETIKISAKEIKKMHRDASRLLSYSDQPNEPKTLYYAVKKPGLYVLQKVVDESKLEVQRKRLAHTVVVPCPKAVMRHSPADKCRGQLSNVEMDVIGTPPLRIKYRKMVNQVTQDASFESIQPDEFLSPLAKQDSSALILPNKIDMSWAQPRTVRVPLSESLSTAGRWVYSIDEVADAFGNTVFYKDEDQEDQERHMKRAPQLHQVITVHERPVAQLEGCNSQMPIKVAKGQYQQLPVKLGSTGKGSISETPHTVEYMFTPELQLTTSGDQGPNPERKRVTLKTPFNKPLIQENGLYTLISVSTDYCSGEIMEPSSCLLQNPPEPELFIKAEEIFDQCAGRPVGMRVDLDLVGTPPFEVQYRITKLGDRHHSSDMERVTGVRGQLVLKPPHAGHYKYEFLEVSDAVYKRYPVQRKDLTIEQDVKPSASARFVESQPRRIACIDEPVSFDVNVQGEGPFSIEYELMHQGRRLKHNITNITDSHLTITTDHLRNGGEYTLALTSVTDRMECKEFLKEQAKIDVRHQRPKVAFGHIEGRYEVRTLEGKRIQLPLKLAGEQPFTVRYRKVPDGKEHILKAERANDRVAIAEEGTYELLSVNDATCPGTVDEAGSKFEVAWIPRPQLEIADRHNVVRKGNTVVMAEVCEGQEDAVEVLFKGSPPYTLQYDQHSKRERGGTQAPKHRELKAALHMASIRMETSNAGVYTYKFSKLEDTNYDFSAKHFTPLTVEQHVNPRPSANFAHPGKTYAYCSGDADADDGEEVIPIKLEGVPPFNMEIEIKHQGTHKAETISIPNIASLNHQLHIPHRTLYLGASSVSIRKISDSRGCSRVLDTVSQQKVRIAVHDAPTIVPLEPSREEYCVGDRLAFGLSGVAPFNVFYNFNEQNLKAKADSGTFRRLAEKPGTFTITGLTDSASQCKASTIITKQINGLPSVRVSKGREQVVDIHEGSETEILFEFSGTPPFEFTYTRSTNAEKGRKSVVLDMRSEISEEYSMRVAASEEGTYEVVAIKDKNCAYTKPGVVVDRERAQKLLRH